MNAPAIPRATYRLQLNREFGFADAARIVPYLARLGISHVYCSPYLKARAGSLHGYDIVDHSALNPEIGSRADYEALVAALAANGMGQLADIVPNHMGVGGDDNPWWLDVLENGQASDYAEFFDIDWQPAKPELRGKVLLPLLEDHYGAVLEQGLLRLVLDRERGALCVGYHEHRLPLDPKTYGRVLGANIEALVAPDGPAAAYRGLLALFEGLPSRHETSPERRAQRNRDRLDLKIRLAALLRESSEVATHVENCVERLNGVTGVPGSFDELHALLEEQAYRAAYWRVAADEINYRRFFDINTLAALRAERPEVFVATHRLILDLFAEGKVHALRVDHPDGLYNPAAYFQMLRDALMARGGTGNTTPYVVAEKILMPGEPLRDGWAVNGTTGYDFAALVTSVLIHPEGAHSLGETHERIAGPVPPFADLRYEQKRLVMRTLLSGELAVLTNLLDRISEASRATRDYTEHTLRDALMCVVAAFPVYRTYATAAGLNDEDRRYVEHAVVEARRRSPAADVTVFDFIRSILLMEGLDNERQAQREAIVDFVMKLQQFTGPVMAKGLEDTSFYRDSRFIALNEVGSDPRRFGIRLEDFHRANGERQARWPHTLLATSTHDTKRAEDVRARLAVLSEIPAGWRDRVMRWHRTASRFKREVGGQAAPDGSDEYFVYQTLVGAWPLEPTEGEALAGFRARIDACLLKSVREGKTHTSWINPNSEYEAALFGFVGGLLESSSDNRFLGDFREFQRAIVRFGLFNSLSQTLLKLAVPGVPDIYQSSELWDFSLVDPDNRRPVDYTHREKLLSELETLDRLPPPERAIAVQALLENSSDGRIKLWLVREALACRARHEALFRGGAYVPLAARGERAENVCAFLRRGDADAAIVAVGRWYTRLPGADGALPVGEAVWGRTALILPPEFKWSRGESALTGEAVELARRNGETLLNCGRLFRHLPVALVECGR